MKDPFYITTPIYYVNAQPHLGHAYTTIIADAARRFHEMCGQATFFLTGTDEHGDKIVRAAKREKMSPRAYADKISGQFKALWPKLHIDYSRFIRTTDPAHQVVVQQILQKIYDAGDIYFAEYEGLYCFGCERFYTERELVNGLCPDHETAPEKISESNYFFRMGRYQQWLIDHIQANPDFIRPERYRNEVLAFLREPLEDLCISRPKSRLQWGISLPFDDNYVTYVWFDALINYVSAMGYPDGDEFARFWPHAQHIVAKDILKPHGIYWPTMLKAAGIPVYRHLNVHGYWNVDQSKMSKSLGNVVDPMHLKDVYGLDPFRFFLLREMNFGLDSSFSEEQLVGRINADLANDLGNLFSRVTAMVHKYHGGRVPATDPTVEADLKLSLQADAWKTIETYVEAMDTFAFHRALQAVWDFINQMNKYIDVTQPWVLAKDKRARPQLDAAIYNLLEGLRIVSGLIYPVMPETAASMQRHLGQNPDDRFYDLERLRAWRGLPSDGVLPKTVTLFPRVEWPRPAPATADADAQPAAPVFKPQISYEEFSRLDLRVATVLKAEAVPKAKKLLKLEIDVGERRTLVAGIAGSYDPADLVGAQILVVANLKPAKLMGILSEGMLLAAVDEKGTALATVNIPMPPGTPLR
jgi:methionyl-tRNA synthetase